MEPPSSEFPLLGVRRGFKYIRDDLIREEGGGGGKGSYLLLIETRTCCISFSFFLLRGLILLDLKGFEEVLGD